MKEEDSSSKLGGATPRKERDMNDDDPIKTQGGIKTHTHKRAKANKAKNKLNEAKDPSRPPKRFLPCRVPIHHPSRLEVQFQGQIASYSRYFGVNGIKDESRIPPNTIKHHLREGLGTRTIAKKVIRPSANHGFQTRTPQQEPCADDELEQL